MKSENMKVEEFAELMELADQSLFNNLESLERLERLEDLKRLRRMERILNGVLKEEFVPGLDEESVYEIMGR